MIRHTLYIRKYDWVVHCFFAVDCYYVYEILDCLRRAGCPSNRLREAYRNLFACNLDTGLTYSNSKTRTSVLVTSLTSSAKEFQDSLVHETGHLATHIAQAFGIPLEGEDIRYLHGDIARSLYQPTHSLLCEHCRKK